MLCHYYYVIAHDFLPLYAATLMVALFYIFAAVSYEATLRATRYSLLAAIAIAMPLDCCHAYALHYAITPLQRDMLFDYATPLPCCCCHAISLRHAAAMPPPYAAIMLMPLLAMLIRHAAMPSLRLRRFFRFIRFRLLLMFAAMMITALLRRYCLRAYAILLLRALMLLFMLAHDDAAIATSRR